MQAKVLAHWGGGQELDIVDMKDNFSKGSEDEA